MFHVLLQGTNIGVRVVTICRQPGCQESPSLQKLKRPAYEPGPHREGLNITMECTEVNSQEQRQLLLKTPHNWKRFSEKNIPYKTQFVQRSEQSVGKKKLSKLGRSLCHKGVKSIKFPIFFRIFFKSILANLKEQFGRHF